MHYVAHGPWNNHRPASCSDTVGFNGWSNVYEWLGYINFIPRPRHAFIYPSNSWGFKNRQPVLVYVIFKLEFLKIGGPQPSNFHLTKRFVASLLGIHRPILTHMLPICHPTPICWSAYLPGIWPLLTKVWRQRFWMIKFGSRTPKASLLWSNSKNVGVFRTGPLRRQRLQRKQPQLVKRYRDGSGQQRFSGIRKNLKKKWDSWPQ